MNNENAKSSSEIDARFALIAGSLLLVIIAILAGLWMRTRTRALRAERDTAAMRIQLKLSTSHGVRFSGGPESFDAMLQQMASKAMRRHKVRRENLRAEQVQLNGRNVDALHLPADAAEKFGFRPGDVIIVDESPPTTAPAPSKITRRRTVRHRSPQSGDG